MARMSRRAFNTGLLAALGLPFLAGKAKETIPPAGDTIQADSKEPGDEESSLFLRDVLVSGQVLTQPILKYYISKDGATGCRCFLRVGTLKHDGNLEELPVVAWGGLAKRIAARYRSGAHIIFRGRPIVEWSGGREFRHVEVDSVLPQVPWKGKA